MGKVTNQQFAEFLLAGLMSERNNITGYDVSLSLGGKFSASVIVNDTVTITSLSEIGHFEAAQGVVEEYLSVPRDGV